LINDIKLADPLKVNIIIKDLTPSFPKRVSDTVVRKTAKLDKLPYMGRKVAELNKELIREIALYSYRIIYEIKADDFIEVLAVIHKRQDFTEEDLP
jgi:plasmid stabilization system protein ParE